MPQYAENTSVPADRSRAEIERTLQRYGARQFMYGYDEKAAMIAFVCAVPTGLRQVRFTIEMPDKNDRKFTHTPTGLRREASTMLKEYEKSTRQRWRALALVIKAKLEAVDAGISEFEHEFLAHIVLPDGQTVGQWMLPQVVQAYESGEMPRLALPAAGETS